MASFSADLLALRRRLGRALAQTYSRPIYRTEHYRTAPEHSFSEQQTEFSEKGDFKIVKIENIHREANADLLVINGDRMLSVTLKIA
jgi:hypothetical protein